MSRCSKCGEPFEGGDSACGCWAGIGDGAARDGAPRPKFEPICPTFSASEYAADECKHCGWVEAAHGDTSEWRLADDPRSGWWIENQRDDALSFEWYGDVNAGRVWCEAMNARTASPRPTPLAISDPHLKGLIERYRKAHRDMRLAGAQPSVMEFVWAANAVIAYLESGGGTNK